jgi:cobalt-zinc-cadmium efflux system outer membrane protein
MLGNWSTTAGWLLAAVAVCASPAVLAQPDGPAAATTLRGIFDAAWERLPEARAAAARRQAAEAARASAQRLTAEPAALELQVKAGRSGAGREYEALAAFPLWLPGERSRLTGLANAQLEAVDFRVRAAQLRLAGSVRDAWWSLKRAEVELAATRDRLESARQLAADVARRVAAGDLARADQHQSEAAVAQAEAAAAEANSARAVAEGGLRAITLAAPAPGTPAVSEPVPPVTDLPGEHPAVAEAVSRAAIARRTMELTNVQRRANPELTLGASRETGGSGEPSVQSLIVGIRVPFGGGPRQDARVATAQAEALEAEATAEVERNRVASEAASARARLQALQAQVQAAERRARLAAETRGFYGKSFRLGETDLPTRLRVELEAAEAQRALAKSRVDAAAAVSQLRQALGLLPE